SGRPGRCRIFPGFSVSPLPKWRVSGSVRGRGGMATSDYQLLDRYAAGDESAFEELVMRHQKTVYNLAYRMLENQADAADLAQKTFVQAFLHHRSFKRESSFRTWLYQICLNQCRNALRDRARLVHEDVEELALAAPQDTFTQVARSEL